MICRPIVNVRNNFLIDQKLSIVLPHYASYTYLTCNEVGTVRQVGRSAGSGGSVLLRFLSIL